MDRVEYLKKVIDGVEITIHHMKVSKATYLFALGDDAGVWECYLHPEVYPIKCWLFKYS